ncbi:LacI family DNA-binding transcriptional regulator [Corynebacterium sp. USCH3]|uniref:LacI family DNA-binding transcriptional regulator n=1 Tax=Corynebacterium sp. USCH3 TaxID=3024840 RepID=UPI0030ED3A89
MVTSFDVARLAGVSQPTVSRAMRGDPRVSGATREKVEYAARTLGYVPSAAGRALSSGKTSRIGLLITDLTNEFYHRMIGPVVARVSERQHEVVLIADDGDVDTVIARISSLGLDGLILATTTTDSIVPYKLRERSVPFVYFNRVAPAVPADAAVVDVTVGMADMVDTIVDAGYSRVGVILGPGNATTGTQRAEQLFVLLGEQGIVVPASYRMQGEFDVVSGGRGFRTLMSLETPPEVIVCGNDVVAIGAVNEAVRSGVSIPGDVAVVGFDDLPEAAWPVFSLSTVGFDLNELVRTAVDLLFDRIAAPDSEYSTRHVASYFVTRSSLPGR